jgi:dienelactone hydrolase
MAGWHPRAAKGVALVETQPLAGMFKNMHTRRMPSFHVPPSSLVDEPELGELHGLSGAQQEVACRVEMDGSVFRSSVVLPVADGSCRLPASLITHAVRTGEVATSADAPAASLKVTLTAAGEECTVERPFLAEGVEVENLPAPLAGRLYLPAGGGTRPVVMLLSGSGGGVNDKEAAQLASRGYACLALAYFNYPGRPDVLVDIELEYFDQAYSWLSTHQRLDPSRVALKGGSRGGELVLELASRFSWPAAVIPVVPGAHRWGGVSPDGDEHGAWTYQGQALPYVPADERDAKAAEVAEDGSIVYSPVFEHALARCEPDVLSAARIPVEQITCPVLLISGQDDAMWHCSEYATAVATALDASRPQVEHTNLVLPDAGHMLFPVGTPVETVLAHPVLPARFALGGTVEGTAAGRERAWQECLDFLDRTLGR